MTTSLQIDFISDVACPWCAIGLASLERALATLGDEVRVELHFQPFELNPTMGSEGADAAEYLIAKYGMSREQLAVNRQRITERGAAVGFRFGERKHVWNTFDAHRLLHWAELEGRQLALKQALFKAYFTDGEDPSAHPVLRRAAESAGLDRVRADAILASDEYATEVRDQQAMYLNAGISSVPAVIINDRHLIQGGQPSEVFVQALRQIAEEGPTALA